MASYQALYHSGELERRAQEALARLGNCQLCPRRCQAQRLNGEVGKCRTGRQAMVSSFGPHFGEEAPLVGWKGSGTVFFTHCSLRCCFCQNYDVSQLGHGGSVTAEVLASIMLSLQARGCHNINLVTPTHIVPQILEALVLAAGQGLEVPLVYNSGGYDSVETLKLLDGVIDIYMPDMKYADEEIASRLSGISSYPEINRAAVREMHRQVGDLNLDSRGVATNGLLVRHLVLPFGLAGSREIVSFLAREVSPHTYVNIMAQYHPCYKAFENPLLDRPLRREEFLEAQKLAREAGLVRLDGEASPAAFRLIFR